MNGLDLKNSILQLAIQGKLVEQREEEGTAKELLKQIGAEKEALIKEKKIKKQKTLPEITKGEKPFGIPENWEWVRIGEIFNLQSGINITASNIFESQTEENNYPCYGGNGLRGYVRAFNREGKYALIGRQGALCGNINFANGKFYATEHAVVVDHFELTDVMWSGYVLKALNLNQYATATAQPGLAVSNIVKILIPLPPLKEQKRIVAKIEELMPYVEEYDKVYAEVTDLNKNSPKDIQKSILQYAIQGKLVEQREEEGTAEELYQQIQEEKKWLIEEGIIKKTKGLPEITEEEIPFDIPGRWKWVRLGEISEKIHYGYTASSKEKGDAKLLRITDIQNDFVHWEDVPYCDIKDTDYAKYDLNNRDILIARTGGTIGKTYIVDLLSDKAVFASYLIRAIPVDSINEKYLKSFMDSPLYWNQLKAGSMGTGQPNVNATTLSQLLIPLPPIEEQKRIVEKIEEMLPYTKKLIK